ncbi:MAG TPA: site-specific DNA-methyltransferase [Terracidiphilus sp.]|nr:site-specific DNA-methyltransferase [Terracidiphilus sp.]
MNRTVIEDELRGSGVRQALVQVPPQSNTGKRAPKSDQQPYVQLTSRAEVTFRLPLNDAAPGALSIYREANEHYRTVPWPAPFNKTTHRLHLGDSRNLSWIPDASVHLVVTSPPYWTLKEYADGNDSQLGDIEDYEEFLEELDKVWRECGRVLVPGGRICCVVGDVCVPRRREGKHYVMPLHSDIQVRSRKLGLDCLTPILWQKIANGVTEAKGNGAGFYGKPYQPGSIVKNDTEYILLLRKGGNYRTVSPVQKVLSMLTKEEMQGWLRSAWDDLPGASTTKTVHPAPFPVELAERLIKLFSFAGDTVLDPFLGIASTSAAAIRAGRNSIGVEVEQTYLETARKKLLALSQLRRMAGATVCEVVCD